MQLREWRCIIYLYTGDCILFLRLFRPLVIRGCGIGCESHLGSISGMAGLVRIGVEWILSMQFCEGRMGVWVTEL